MSALSDILNEANVQDWPLDELTSRMRDRGHEISRDTVWRYTTGRVRSVRREFLEAFVDILPGLTISKLETAGAVPVDLGDWTPPHQARFLTSAERHALTTLIKGLAANRTVEPPVSGGEPQVVLATEDLAEVRVTEVQQADERGPEHRSRKPRSPTRAGEARPSRPRAGHGEEREG